MQLVSNGIGSYQKYMAGFLLDPGAAALCRLLKEMRKRALILTTTQMDGIKPT